MKIRPFDAPGTPRRRPGHHDRALPLRQLATALGVSRADLRTRSAAPRRGRERLEAGAAGARQVPRRPLQPRSEQGAGRAGRRGAATKVTASAGTTRPSHSSLRRQPPPSLTGGGSSSRTRPTPTPRLASGSRRAAAGLSRHGVAKGDLVLATARNDPRYVFLWLATAYLGAIYVGVDPRQTEAELDGLIGQVEPMLVVTDDEPRRAVLGARRARRPRTGHPRRPGRPHPHLGHDRALEARDPDAPRLRHGRRGLPVVARADRGGPADDLAAALPHQRARLLGARLGGRPREPRAPPPLLGQRLLRLRPPLRRHRSSTRSGRCSRS